VKTHCARCARELERDARALALAGVEDPAALVELLARVGSG
jgi:hypothetical protein